ncbi:MAG: hypothetical protein JKY89_03710 [Immundisolibacteraceae bacterium]|nr:hypothetical protein [Immundisolibacteraceae bacterium]
MALTNQEQIQVDDIDTRVSINAGNVSKNQADIQGIDNENYFKIIKRSFVHTGCEISKSGSDLSISLSKGSDSKSIAIVEGKYLEVSDSTVFISANTSGSTRIDLAYLSREGGLLIKVGVAGSGLAPSLPSNSLELYTLSIPTGTTVNLSACTLVNRRINVNSGHYLPSTGIALNESFLLTQQDGANLDGLYYWDGSSWYILSSGGLVSNYYTKELVDVLSAGMTEAEFRARQQENKRNRDGSGFDSFGLKTLYPASFDDINVGLSLINHSGVTSSFSNKIFLAGLGAQNQTNYPKCNMNGASISLLHINESLVTQGNAITLPDAPTDEKARQDLIGLEYWEEETDHVHSKGCTQSLATSLNGISTVVASFSGADTYSRFGTWQAAGELIGRVVKFSTATVLQKMAMLSDPENCLFFNELGNLTQGKNRVRVIKGHTSNGAEWEKFIQNNTGTLKYSTGLYPKAKGMRTSISNDISNYNADETGAFAIDGFNVLGCYQALNQSGVNGAIDATVGSKGNCFFMPIAMVSRNINQGAYHRKHNDGGSKKFSDDKNWNETTVSVTSTADCFDTNKILAASGYIASGKSGRPDGFYYDEINQSDVRDLRLPTNYNKNVEVELAEHNKADKRGYEAEFELKYVNPVSATLDVKTTLTWVGSTATSLTFSGENILGSDIVSLGDGVSIDKNNIAFIKDDTGVYREINYLSISATPNSYIHLHPRYGNITANFTLTNTYSVVASVKTDRFHNNTIQRCEIIGDPANYTSGGVGIANVIDVNDGSSNLPVDNYSSPYISIRMSNKSSNLYGSKVYVDSVLYSVGSPANSNEFNNDNTNNMLNINIDASYAGLGYANATDMLNGCVIEVFHEGYAQGFIPSVTEILESFTVSHSFQSNFHGVSAGALFTSNFLNKINSRNGGKQTRNFMFDSVFIDFSTSKLYTDTNNFIVESLPTDLDGLIDQPAIKVFLYQANKNGLLYNVIVFKEMKFDVDWGDDQKFDITDNIKTKTDDNGNVIIYGTVIYQNPVGFAKVLS